MPLQPDDSSAAKLIPLVSVLATQRRLLGLSLPQLAAVTGIDKGTLSRYERGLSPSPEHARRLAVALAAAARDGEDAA